MSAHEGRHRRTVERAYDLVQSWFGTYAGKHRGHDFI
jgi:hypothetical protein